jgi:hypothetical protein
VNLSKVPYFQNPSTDEKVLRHFKPAAQDLMQQENKLLRYTTYNVFSDF